MKFAVLLVVLCSVILAGCATIGAALPVVCSTVDEICAYKDMLCRLQMNADKNMTLQQRQMQEKFLRAKLNALADSLKAQSSPVAP